jgi:dynein heavy chain, axonemal
LDEYDEVPWKMLNYCTGQCNYGGRVTDDKDRRCITHILRGFYTPEVLKDEYRFSKSGIFYAPPEGDHASYLMFIRQLPLAEGPECYGLHDNAAITSAILETTSTLGKALSLQPRSTGGAAESWESKLSKTASDLETRMPELFDIERIFVAYPTKFEDSMNTILTQEVERFNNLLKLVKTTLRDVQRALLGEMVMSEELEAMGDSLVNGLVPNMWSAKSYPSLKPLGPWTIDFLERLTFMNTWVENDRCVFLLQLFCFWNKDLLLLWLLWLLWLLLLTDTSVFFSCFVIFLPFSPVVYWISGFFFTQSFLTGTRQNYARATSIPIDELGFDFQVFTPEDSAALTEQGKPDRGAYVNGLFFQGAMWDPESDGCEGGGGKKAGAIRDSAPRVLFMPMPSFWLIVSKTVDVIERHTYTCPTYKTSMRQGQLSTTGHSTNYIMAIELPMRPDETERKWVKAGVAMLAGLDD